MAYGLTFGLELERHILDWAARPGDYLLPRKHTITRWWYGCLERAGVVAEGVTSGERMHKAGTPPASASSTTPAATSRPSRSYQGHSSVSTTGDVYTDWDIDQLADTLRGMYDEAGSGIVRPKSYEIPANRRFMGQAGIEPAGRSRQGGAGNGGAARRAKRLAPHARPWPRRKTIGPERTQSEPGRY